MLKIMGLLSVLLSLPALGSAKSAGLLGDAAGTGEAGLPSVLGAPSLAEPTHYTAEEALPIAHELYGEYTTCKSCGRKCGLELAGFLSKVSRSDADQFNASALEIKRAIDPTHGLHTTKMINQLLIIFSLGGLGAVGSAMESFREISDPGNNEAFSTSSEVHLGVISTFDTQIRSLQALAGATSKK